VGNFLFLFFTVAKQRDPKSKQTTVSTWAKLSPKFVSFGSELEVWSCATEHRRACIENIRHDCLPILLVAAIVVIVPLFSGSVSSPVQSRASASSHLNSRNFQIVSKARLLFLRV
jgi:hypothetical protein